MLDSLIAYPQAPIFVLSLIIVAGLALLTFGGDRLCIGASGIALKWRVSPIIVGLTVVSIATSVPELMTTVYSVVEDSPDLAVGNIVGSNLCNAGLILGIAALIYPIYVSNNLIRKEIPFLLASSIVFWVLAYTGRVSQIAGLVFVIAQVAYFVFLVRRARTTHAHLQRATEKDIQKMASPSWGRCILYVFVASLCLQVGAEVLVNASVELSSRLGVSETLVGLTLVALGTSLPELATTIAAALKGESDLCVGNIIGSNLFNILVIAGGVSCFEPLRIPASLLRLEIPAMVLITLILSLVFMTDRKVTRLEGAVLLFSYFGVIAFSALSELQ